MCMQRFVSEANEGTGKPVINVYRQTFCSRTFIGNHVHRVLKTVRKYTV